MTVMIPIRKLQALVPDSQLVGISLSVTDGKTTIGVGYDPWVSLPEGLGETSEEAWADFLEKMAAR